MSAFGKKILKSDSSYKAAIITLKIRETCSKIPEGVSAKTVFGVFCMKQNKKKMMRDERQSAKKVRQKMIILCCFCFFSAGFSKSNRLCAYKKIPIQALKSEENPKLIFIVVVCSGNFVIAGNKIKKNNANNSIKSMFFFISMVLYQRGLNCSLL